MNKVQSAKLRNIKLICSEAVQHAESVAKVPKFESGVARLNEIYKEINELKVHQEKDNTGATSDKNQLKEDLITSLVDFIGAIQSFAHSKKDKALHERVNFSESELETMKERRLNTIGSLIIAEAEALAAEDLLTEGISAEDLFQLKQLHQAFAAKIDEPRELAIERSNYTRKIAELMDEAWELKKQILDKLISQFKRKDPDFYLKYQAASQVIYRLEIKTALK
jgi:hypothetical protein